MTAGLPAELEGPVAACAAAFARVAALPTGRRAAILETAAAAVDAERDAWIDLIAREVHKPVGAAGVEVSRAAAVLRLAAEEARRLGGTLEPADADEESAGRFYAVKRVPRGPALFITPFNFPLNLVVHKAAPAIAAGLPFVLKPAPQAPECARKLRDTLVRAGWPGAACHVAEVGVEAAEALVRDPRFAILSFTGSAAVGWKLKSLAGRKHVCLELGGNAAALVRAGADLPWAAARIAAAGYGYAGQACISVQRVLVERAVYREFLDLFLANVHELRPGAAHEAGVDLGPLISSAAADRVEAWIDEAVAAGARALVRGTRSGALLTPTVLENVPASCKAWREEVFGPVVCVEAFDDWDAALRKADDGDYGLQAGVFTDSLSGALEAWNRLRVGGVIVNDVPTLRLDAMPYGGSKASGIGREGPRAALEEFTEPRVLVVKP